MITLEEALIMGVHASRPHQRVISKLNTELGIYTTSKHLSS